jgi:very-short-patch-repair endonuclease
LQQPIYADDGGLIARVDFYWEEYGLVGEADGKVKYVDEQALFREKQRRDAIEESYQVIRWTWRQAHEPDELFRNRLLAAIARAQARRAA